jgi:hypothetical protein
MPKHRADTVLKGVPKLPCNHDQVAGCVHQSEYIVENSFTTLFPYDYYASSSKVCVMDRTH